AILQLQVVPARLEVRRAVVRERVPVQVEPQVGDVVAALVDPADRLLSPDTPADLVIAGLDPVVRAAGQIVGDLCSRRKSLRTEEDEGRAPKTARKTRMSHDGHDGD